MDSDIKLDGDRVLIEGRVGIGTTNPARVFHVEGTEIHSGGAGAGFSFSDRGKDFVEMPQQGERWVLYASGGSARLWSGVDRFSVNALGEVNANTIVTNSYIQPWRIDGRRHGIDGTDQDSVWIFAKDIMLLGRKWNESTKAFEPRTDDAKPTKNFALSHVEGDLLVINRGGGYTGGVQIEGNVNIKNELSAPSASIQGNIAAESVKIKSLTISDETSFPAISVTNKDKFPASQITAFNKAQAALQAAVNAVQVAQVQNPQSVPQLQAAVANAQAELQKTAAAQRRSLAAHSDNDTLLLNPTKSYTGGVRIDGNVNVNGVLTQASSKTIKENINQLSNEEALSALSGLNPVKFNYRLSELKETHVGFIAEEIPELIAVTDRKSVSPLDIIAVLTKVAQQQQKTISEMERKIEKLTLSQ